VKTLSIYEITSLKHLYAGKTILDIEQLTVQPATIVGLFGPNGSGKSTLLRLLGLIEKPSQGKILFDGKSVEPFSEEARFQITILPQEPFLLKRNVYNNVSYGLKLRGDSRDIARRVDRALSLVGLAGNDFNRRPWYALSGGETQRVALAARLALNPKVLLMDEPTANVDAASAWLIKEAALKARHELGTTVIVASHDWHWLYEVCDETIHIIRGKVFGSGREALIFGPWQNLKKGLWVKSLSDGQQLRVPRPPETESVAIINDFTVKNDDSQVSEDAEVLIGSVSRLNLERKTGQIFATIMISDLPFTIGLAPQRAQDRNIYPGKTVFIHYRPERIKWV
jgi:tungstate transport system ATP-binding protein